MTRSVVVTGMGAVSGLGVGFEENWRRVFGGQGGIRAIHRQGWEGEPDFTVDGVAAWLEEDVVAAALPKRDSGGHQRRILTSSSGRDLPLP